MASTDQQTEESSLLYFLRLVISNWKFLFVFNFVVGVITIIILLLLPKWYKSDATVVILDENTSALSSVMSDFASLGLGFSSSTSVDTYIEYLNTSKMYDRLITEFKLDSVYKTEFKEDTYGAIFENLGVSDNENRTFTISFSYKEDPEKARDIVEYMFYELDKITLEVDKAQASNFRTYIENYYYSTLNKLQVDEDSLISFQERTGVLDLSAQVEVTIQGIAELEIQKVALEVEREYLMKSFQNSSQIVELEKQIEAISEKIEELTSNQSFALLSMDDIPQRGADFIRLTRDITIGTQVSEFLRLQYEQALLDEQKINSNLYMVDPPQVPGKKFKPQRSRLLLVTMFFSGILSLIIIRARDFYLNEEAFFQSLLIS